MTARATPRLYPCNRGIPGPDIGYHEFHHAGGGIITCRYCGESPQAYPTVVTRESSPR